MKERLMTLLKQACRQIIFVIVQVTLISFAANAQKYESLYDAISKIQDAYPELPTLNLKSANMDSGSSQGKRLLEDIKMSRWQDELIKYVVINNKKMSKAFAKSETTDTLGFWYRYINDFKFVSGTPSVEKPKNCLGVGAGLFFDNFGFGYSFGLNYDIFVSRRLSLDIGFEYHRQNKKYTNYTFKIPDTEFIDYGNNSSKYGVFSSDNISMPVGFTYYLPLTEGIDDLEVVNLMFYAGVEFSYGLKMKEKLEFSTNSCWDKVSETYVSWNYNETKDLFSGEFSGTIPNRTDIYQHLHKYAAFDENTYKRFDLGLSVGIGIQLTRWFEIWAGYEQGLINKVAAPDGNSKYLNMFYLRCAFNIIH